MTIGSCFSGIGGELVAASMLGWDVKFFCEKNPFGNRVLSYWYPNAKNYEDITTADFTEWRGRVDVLTGGFPCQPFSYAGRRRGAEDDRYLWPSMYRAIDEIQPTWVVAENVAGILTMVEQGEVSKVAGTATLFDAFDDLRGRYELRETFTLQRICTDLESHGYAVQPVLVPACAVGAPHRRDRVFIVARRLKDTDLSGRPIRRSCEGCEEHGDGRTAEHASSGRTEMPNDTPRAKENERGGTRCADGCTCDADRHQYATDTINKGLQGRNDCDTQGHGQDSDGCTRQLREVYGREGDSTTTIPENTMHSGLIHGQDEVEGGQRNEWDIGAGGCERLRDIASRFEDTEAIAGIGRWANFPSVSPVHRGNDGLPFDVDRLTLSFGKWRTEALKAYGNAIVPQVMYEIFRAIEIVEQQNNEL